MRTGTRMAGNYFVRLERTLCETLMSPKEAALHITGAAPLWNHIQGHAATQLSQGFTAGSTLSQQAPPERQDRETWHLPWVTQWLDSWLILVNEEFPKSLLSNGSANPIHRQDFFILRKLKLPENKNFPLLIYRYCFDEGNHDIWIFSKWAVPVHYP